MAVIFCKLIKEESSTIPVLLISANIDLEKKAKECNADKFVTKPFDMQYLLGSIQELIA
jgi:DNA-binding response OmpR family regulator